MGLWSVIISHHQGLLLNWSLVLDDFEKMPMMKTRANCKSSNITVSDLRKCTQSSLTFHNQNADHDSHDDDSDEGDDDDNNDDDGDVLHRNRYMFKIV